MEADSLALELQKFFSKATRSDWEKIATQEINGKNPFETLSWRGKDDIFFLPYYDAEKDSELLFLKHFQLPAAPDALQQTWLNLPKVSTANVQQANADALSHLQNGADGVAFDVGPLDDRDLNDLTNNIQWQKCYPAFFMRDHSHILNSLDLLKKKIPPLVKGALFWESVPKKNNLDFYLDGDKNVKALGLIVKGSSPANELADALFEGVKIVDSFSGRFDVRTIFSSICFSLPADASFFETLAKFKAARILWYQIAQSYGIRDYHTQDLTLHARIEDTVDSQYGPHENMLKATFSAIAATLGGCDLLTIENETNDALFAGWSRNVSAILREESHFHEAADATAGAWAVDTIVNEIASKAWKTFQKKWSEYAT